MRTAFNIAGTVLILSTLGLIGSFGLELLTQHGVVAVANGELTVKASVPDRILLSVWAITALAMLALWSQIRGGRA